MRLLAYIEMTPFSDRPTTVTRIAPPNGLGDRVESPLNPKPETLNKSFREFGGVLPGACLLSRQWLKEFRVLRPKP